MKIPVARLLVVFAALASARAESPNPHLQPQGTAMQLIVDGRPFLIRGGEINVRLEPGRFSIQRVKLYRY